MFVSRIHSPSVIATCSLVILLAFAGSSRQSVTAQTMCNPEIDHYEFTQAIQAGQGQDPRFEPSTNGFIPAPPIAQIDGRTTAIRTYVKSEGLCVSGTLVGTVLVLHNGFPIAGSPIYGADNMSTAVAHPPMWDRRLEHETLNFTFYPDGANGQNRDLDIRVCVGKRLSAGFWEYTDSVNHDFIGQGVGHGR